MLRCCNFIDFSVETDIIVVFPLYNQDLLSSSENPFAITYLLLWHPSWFAAHGDIFSYLFILFEPF